MAAPSISSLSWAVRQGYRKPGTLKKAISVRNSKVARRSGDVGVFVNVRPAKGAKYKTTTKRGIFITTRTKTLVRASRRGAKNPDDPFYWRFVEFGTKYIKEYGFLQRGAKELPQALSVFLQKIIPAIEKLNKPKAPAP